MATDLHPLSKIVQAFYNKLNKETNFVCRLNAEDLTSEQSAVFNRLSEDVKKRYYGSGINIPEKLAGKRVLDIGSGSGSLVFILSKLVGPDGYVVGIDMSDGLVETAKSQAEYHWRLWGHSKPNFEFRLANAEQLNKLDLQPESFDLIVSNGVFCLVPDKDRVFTHAFNLLKAGGQFYLNDVYAEKDTPPQYKDNETLWCLGAAGAMRWDTLTPLAKGVGFATPYLTQAAPINIKEEYMTMLENGRFVCAGWRLFKLPDGAHRGASQVTYNGNIHGLPVEFTWDVDLTFKKGQTVDVDSELATVLSSSYLSDSFDFAPIAASPTTMRFKREATLKTMRCTGMKSRTVARRMRLSVCSCAVMVSVCVLTCAPESQGQSVRLMTTNSTKSESHLLAALNVPDIGTVGAAPSNHKHLEHRVKRYSGGLFQELLMLTVTVLKQTAMPDGQPLTFWADTELVSMTVIVHSSGDQPMSCVLANKYGDMPSPGVSEAQTVRWDIRRPSIGAWHLFCESNTQYGVTVQGTSSLDVEVSLYHTDVNTGLAEPVKDTPTAGRQVRAIVDVIGHDFINTVSNISLMTSDGRELGGDWMKHAGSPTDPQYQTTFTWPAEPVYIRVFGQETDGSYFERQLSFLIPPNLLDLELDGDPTDLVHPGKATALRFVITNRGQPDTFLVNASVDNQDFRVSVSPAQIRLGHLSSFVGRLSVNVNLTSSSATGMLHITATSVSDPTVKQSATQLLTAEDRTTDRTSPSCHVISITGNCSKLEVSASQSCEDFDWAVRASVMDVESGLRYVKFADMTSTNDYVISPFSQGQANEPVFVSYRASCCRESVPLDVSDTAGNEFRCEILQMDIERQPGPATLSTAASSGQTQHRGFSNTSDVTPGHALSSPQSPTRIRPEVTKTGSAFTAASTPDVLGIVGMSMNITANRPKGSKQHWEDYSTLKTVSIALGAVGGLAGLSIVFLCFIYYYRYRRQRERRYSDDSSESINSNHPQHHRNHHPQNDVVTRDRNSHIVPPDILPTVARRETNTPL